MTISRLFLLLFAGMMSNNIPALDTGNVYYVVVIDAGSTGSRVHAYKFSLPTDIYRQSERQWSGNSLPADLFSELLRSPGRVNRNYLDVHRRLHLHFPSGLPKTLLLDDELYVARKPGLSSYTKNPIEGAESIVELIKKADYFVPKHKRIETPLIVRATAGLRSLPERISGNILFHVRNAIDNLGYMVTYHSVDILQGKDEGINMWYAVNLLTDTLGKTNPLPALEMGGASAQVTFALNPGENTINLLNSGFVRPAVFNRSLFSQSYHGLGIEAARFGTLQLEGGNAKTERFISVCVGPTKYKDTIFGRNIQMRGVSRKGLSPKEVYLRCQKFVRAYIMATMRYVMRLPNLKKIAAMGYYYHFANNEGLIPHNRNGNVTIKKLLAHAVSPTGGCATYDMQNPWRCFDVVFVVSLLRYGLGINKNTLIHLYDKIDGYSVDWSLGIAYNYVMAEITAKLGLDDVHSYLQKILEKMRK